MPPDYRPGSHHTLHGAEREAGLDEAPEEGERTHGSIRRRLDDHRITGGKRRAYFVGDQQQRIVEGCDRNDDPGRLLECEPEAPLPVGAPVEGQHLAGDPARFSGAVTDEISETANLGASLPDGLSSLGYHYPGQLLDPRLADRSRLLQQDGPFVGAQLPHRRHSRLRPVEYCGDILVAGGGHLTDRGAAIGAVDRHRFARRKRPAGQDGVLDGLNGKCIHHGSSPPCKTTISESHLSQIPAGMFGDRQRLVGRRRIHVLLYRGVTGETDLSQKCS